MILLESIFPFFRFNGRLMCCSIINNNWYIKCCIFTSPPQNHIIWIILWRTKCDSDVIQKMWLDATFGILSLKFSLTVEKICQKIYQKCFKLQESTVCRYDTGYGRLLDLNAFCLGIFIFQYYSFLGISTYISVTIYAIFF